MSEANEFRFVTTGPPGPKNECVFVELEDEQGHGLGPDVATWREHQSGSGLWSLCVPDLRAALAEMTRDRDWLLSAFAGMTRERDEAKRACDGLRMMAKMAEEHSEKWLADRAAAEKRAEEAERERDEALRNAVEMIHDASGPLEYARANDWMRGQLRALATPQQPATAEELA